MSNNDTNAIKDKIRKLLNLANNSGAMEGEINNALMFAERLMAQYHIRESDLKQETVYDFKNEKKEILKSFTHGVRITYWENTLASFVMKFVGSVGCYIDHNLEFKRDENGVLETDKKGEYIRAEKIAFYGLEDDVHLANELFGELQLIIAVMAKMKYGTILRKAGADYAAGFVSGLNTKLDNREQRLLSSEPSASNCTALVVKSNEVVALKKQEIRRWISQDMGMRFGQGKSYNNAVKDNSAYGAGRVDGAKMNVGGLGGNSAPRKKLS